jgi:hypothetical protein
MIKNRATKQSPHLDRVENEMGRIGMGHFMGSDPRKLAEILIDDQELVNSLDLTHEEIALRLEEITRAAKRGLGDPIFLEDRYEVRFDEARGKIPCPWMHPGGLFPKSHIELKDKVTNETLVWTDLSVHLIREHQFYQGKGSPYRLEPEVLKRVLWGAS